MVLMFDGTDITSQVDIASAVIVDSSGGALDSVEVEFADLNGLWSQWQPSTGSLLQLSQDGFDSGVCYVDQIGQRRGLYILRALSAPVGVKQQKSRSWEQVQLLQLAADVAASYGFMVNSYDITNHTYSRADQVGQGDLEFLMDICSREGYAVKVNNRRLLIYSENVREQNVTGKIISKSDWCGEPDYNMAQTQYSACCVSVGSTSATFVLPTVGEVLTLSDLSPSNIGEAERWAKGLLRQANRSGETLTGDIMLDLSIAAGTMVTISDIGTADGVYIIDQVEHNLIDAKSSLQLRKRLEGY